MLLLPDHSFVCFLFLCVNLYLTFDLMALMRELIICCICQLIFVLNHRNKENRKGNLEVFCVLTLHVVSKPMASNPEIYDRSLNGH